MFRRFIQIMAIGLSIGFLAAVATGQTKKMPAAPTQLHVQPWCEGAYSAKFGTNFAPCPTKYSHQGLSSVQSPGSGGAGSAAGASSSSSSSSSGGGGTSGGGSGSGGGHK